VRNPSKTHHGASPRLVGLRQRLIPYEEYISYAFYLSIVAICWRGYAFRIGPDIVSYVSIAQEYFAGHWWNAVNTFWSPLLSWIIAAGMVTHIPVYALARCLVVIWGLVGLTGIRRLTLQCGLPPDLRTGVLVIAAPMLASFAVMAPSPDFVGVCLMILYLSATSASSSNDRQPWLVAGILGGLLYLTKAYMFGFVITHLTFMTILRLWAAVKKVERRKILSNYLGAIACLLVLSSPWLVLIGLKAGHPMLSETGSWNYAKARMDPEWFPQLTEGLFAPPTSAAVSIWEDPGRMHIPLWNPLTSTEAARWQIYLVLRNCLYFFYFMIRASVFSIAIVPYFAWVLWRRIRGGQVSYSWACLLSAYVIYPLGYLLIALGEQRYIWIESILLLLMGACVASVFREHLISWHRLGPILTVLLGLSFWGDPLGTLLYHWGEGRDVHSIAESLRPLKLSGNVASNGQWGDSLYICYELGLHYYGIPRKQSGAAVEQELRKKEINYLLVWNDPTVPVPFVHHLREFLLRSHRMQALVSEIHKDPNGAGLNTLIGTGTQLTVAPQGQSLVGQDAHSQERNLQQDGKVQTGDAAMLAATNRGVELAIRRSLRIYELPAGKR